MTHLQELNLMNARIRNSGLRILSRRLQNLTILNLRGCTNISDVGLQFISRMSKLEALNLQSCHVGDKGMLHLSQGTLALLHLVIFFTDVTQRGIGVLCAGQRSLKTLNISSTVGEEGALHAIDQLPLLRVLRVSWQISPIWKRIKRTNPLLSVRIFSSEYLKSPHVLRIMQENAFIPAS